LGFYDRVPGLFGKFAWIGGLHWDWSNT